MPELPEVETIRRDLEGCVVGARVEGFWSSGQRMRLGRPVPAAALARISIGRRIVGLRRRAKYLLIDVEGDAVVVLHLGMSGQLRLGADDEARPPHTHVAWRLDGGRELRYVDARRFGLVTTARRGAEDDLPELAILGIDPLSPELTAERLFALARACRRDLKTFLLDQTRVAGIGNIYACEALFEARLNPRERADRLKAAQAGRLRDSIVAVLERGLKNRGTTLRDYVDAAGAAGGNQHDLRVYGREGEPCPRGDGGRVRRVVQGGRSTFFCPICQGRAARR